MESKRALGWGHMDLEGQMVASHPTKACIGEAAAGSGGPGRKKPVACIHPGREEGGDPSPWAAAQ